MMGLKSPSPASTPTASSRRIKATIHRGKRNRGSFHQNSYDQYIGSQRRNETDEVRMEECVDNALKKLKMNEDTDNVKLPISERLPTLNDSDEECDVDFSSVNQVLNELYRERCFRRNVNVYSALADSLSNSLYDGNQGAQSFPKNEEVFSSSNEVSGQFNFASNHDGSCSSIPP